jgi:predicted TIM-barrel fold metal-dependent hydrolase
MTASATLDWVIDTDTHISEPGDLWTSRLPAKFRKRCPRIVRDAETQVEVWQIGDGDGFLPVGFTAVAGWEGEYPNAPRNMDEVPLAAHDAKARLEYMDSLGIWAMALYPNVGGFGSQAFLSLDDRALMLACVQAYNDFLLDWIEPAPRRFIPVMATPFWDVDASVKEIERCAARGHKGVLFTGEPQSHGMPYLASDHWNPLWAAAQACDLPISFHIGAGNFVFQDQVAAVGMATAHSYTNVALFLDNGKQIADLLFSGILARYPDLKFISVESGIGFLPFVLETAERSFDETRLWTERPELKLRPSEYFARQVYGCYFYEEIAPQRLLDVIGEDNVLFETDYPHPVCLYGDVREKIDAGLADATPETRKKILFDNAAKLYKLDPPDIDPPVVASV